MFNKQHFNFSVHYLIRHALEMATVFQESLVSWTTSHTCTAYGATLWLLLHTCNLNTVKSHENTGIAQLIRILQQKAELKPKKLQSTIFSKTNESAYNNTKTQLWYHTVNYSVLLDNYISSVGLLFQHTVLKNLLIHRSVIHIITAMASLSASQMPPSPAIHDDQDAQYESTHMLAGGTTFQTSKQFHTPLPNSEYEHEL